MFIGLEIEFLVIFWWELSLYNIVMVIYVYFMVVDFIVFFLILFVFMGIGIFYFRVGGV